MRRLALATGMLLAACAAAPAADQVKLGNLTQLSGPISPAGTETKRGIDLALEELGNKLGGLPVKYTVVDDKTNPAEAVQGASKLIDDAKVDFVTGLGASNTLIPVFKSFVNAGIFTVGALAGPLQFAGKECHPNGFFVSFTNDDWPAAAGKYMSDKGIKSAFFLGADYQAGYEHVGAAIKYFKGKAIGPVYTPLTQLDFAPEIARIRAEKPDAVFAFLVGAGGVAFSKQYAQAGLQSQIPFYTEDPVANPLTFPAQGDAAIGIIMSTNWAMELDNASEQEVRHLVHGEAQARARHLRGARLRRHQADRCRGQGRQRQDRGQGRGARGAAQGQLPVGARLVQVQQQPLPDPEPLHHGGEEGREGQLKAVLKDTAIKDWQDPYHQECPMKW